MATQPTTTVAIAGTRGHYAATLAELAAVPDIKVVGLCGAGDPVEPLVRWCVAHGHPVVVFDSFDAMLAESLPDAVVVCGPFERHAAMSAAAIRRGTHVLTEKPAALTSDQLADLRRACHDRPDVHLAGMMFSRYAAGFATARRLIAYGAIGDLRLIDARKSYKLGTRPDYYRQRETYGGTIPWVGSHAIDWVMHLTGDARPFRSVYARHSTLGNGGNGTMESSAACQFELDGDLRASVSIDYLRPAGAPTHGDDWARVVGTRGVLEVRPDSLTLTDENGSRDVPVRSDKTLVADFFNHIRGRGPGLLTTASTLALTDACLRALRSADERRPVAFDQ